jgi:hypothetical protein
VEIGRFDWLAAGNGIEFEIECKTTSADTGRKIHRRELNRLAHYLLPTTKKLVEEGGFHLVRLVLPDRLEPGDRYLRQLGSVVSEATKGVAAASDEGHAEYRTMDLKHLPSPQELGVVAGDAVAKVFGTENNHRHFMYHLHPSGLALAVVAVESEKPDTVLQYIADQAKYAAGQCTGKRPALVLVQLVEINPEDIRSLLDTPSGIHFIAHEVFKNDARSYVDSIIFCLPPTIQAGDLGAPVAIIHNPSPSISNIEVRGVFRSFERTRARLP